VYHYNNVNVEAQMASSSSLLHWLRGMLQVRSRHPVFGLGDFTVVPNDNEALLSFVRSVEPDGTEPGETVLCVNNLSSRPQAATIQLPEHLGERQLVDLFGGSGFPWVAADGRVTITLGSRDFFWLQVAQREGS
jgi:maltose alpha-D-glucosyltransferase/alpha-amylase